MSPHKAGDRKARLQFEPPLGRHFGLRDAAELGQGCRLQEMGEAEARHRLDRVAAGGDNAFPIACRAVRDAKPGVVMTDAWVQWAARVSYVAATAASGSCSATQFAGGTSMRPGADGWPKQSPPGC